MLQMNPRYMEIADFAEYLEPYAIKHMREMAQNYDTVAKGAEDTRKFIKKLQLLDMK